MYTYLGSSQMLKAFQFRPRVEDFSTEPRESQEVDKEMKAKSSVKMDGMNKMNCWQNVGKPLKIYGHPQRTAIFWGLMSGFSWFLIQGFDP